MDKKKLAEMLIGFSETFGKPLSPAGVKIYLLVLGHLTEDQINRAITHIIKTHKYKTMPNPGEILEAIEGNAEDAALLALHKLEKAMFDYGARRSVMFDDPAIHHVVNTVEWNGEKGWIALCHMPLDELKWWKKDFPKLYRSIGQSGRTARPLLGIDDFWNIDIIKDYKAKVYLIGNREKAMTLLEYKEQDKMPELEMKKI